MAEESDREEASRGDEWLYRDNLFTMMMIFLVVAALAVAQLKAKEEGVHTGSLLFDISWDTAVDADVDLWVRAPDGTPVGFSSKRGRYCDLLRDDTGKSNDPGSRNQELTVCRESPPGEYVVNVHEYSSSDNKFPIQVDVSVTQPRDGGSKSDAGGRLLKKTVWLQAEGEEVTVFRFSLDKDGRVVPGSVNDIPLTLIKAAHQ